METKEEYLFRNRRVQGHEIWFVRNSQQLEASLRIWLIYNIVDLIKEIDLFDLDQDHADTDKIYVFSRWLSHFDTTGDSEKYLLALKRFDAENWKVFQSFLKGISIRELLLSLKSEIKQSGRIAKTIKTSQTSKDEMSVDHSQSETPKPIIIPEDHKQGEIVMHKAEVNPVGSARMDSMRPKRIEVPQSGFDFTWAKRG